MPRLEIQDRVLQTVVGALLCLAGMAVLLALWVPALQLEHIALLYAPNAALAFVLIGIAMCNPRPLIAIVCTSLTLVLSTAVLAQYLLGVDLQVDSLAGHLWFEVPSAYPGRMSPQTALCFIGAALSLLLWQMPFATRAATVAQVLALSLTTFAIISLVGYCFDLEVLYRWYGYSRMSPYAGGLFVLAGVALWLKWYRRAIDAGRFEGHEDERVKLIASSLIVLVTGVAGASGFILLAARSEQASQTALVTQLTSKVELLAMQLDERVRAVDRLAAQLASPEGAALARRASLQPFIDADFTAIRWQAADGTVQTAGRFVQPSAETLPLDDTLRLLRADGVVLHIERAVGADAPAGHLAVETRLGIAALLAPHSSNGDEVRLCVAPQGHVRCLPIGMHTSTASLSAEARIHDAVARALQGGQGTLPLLDDKGRPLIAAYTSATRGLTVVLLQDSRDVYATLGESRLALAVILTIVIFVGMALLRSLLNPLTRQASEARLAAAQSGTRTEAIMNSVADGVVTFDMNGQIITANPALYEMFGYRPGELVGESVNRLLSDGQPATRDAGWQRYASQRAATRAERFVEVAGRRRDGSTFAAQLALTEMRLGDAVYLVGNVRDVTLAKFAEAQLRRANERFKLATRAARLGVFEWDLASGVLIWDAIVHQLHDVPLDSPPTYDTWRRMVHPDDLSRLEQEVSEAIALGRDIAFEFRIVLPDCSERALRTAATVARDPGGNPMRITGVTWDVTESRRLDRMKSEFISVVSHELRTPLTSIRGALGLIAGTATTLPEKTRQLFDIAYRNTDRLALLVSDILDVEKIEFGGLAFNHEMLNVRELVEQAIENNQAYAAERGVRLQLVTSNDDIFVMGDANRLLQVMANLLSNAAKFSPSGAPVDIAILPMASAVRVSVRDYGPGIPESFQPRVFQKFAQADASDTRAKGGTGLGLAISKAIVERLGGRIGYDCGPGVGTLFYFDLPLAHDLTESGVWRQRLAGMESRAGSL